MPVLFKLFLVQLCPGEDEAQLPAAEVAIDHLEVVDTDVGFSFGMMGVLRSVRATSASSASRSRRSASTSLSSSSASAKIALTAGLSGTRLA